MCQQIKDRMLYLERNNSLGGWYKVFSVSVRTLVQITCMLNPSNYGTDGLSGTGLNPNISQMGVYSVLFGPVRR